MSGRTLDLWLSRGYYRMQQDVFTCRFIWFDNRACPVHWLRIDLRRIQYGPKQRRLLRYNEKFQVVVRPFALTNELENLYARYRAAIDFDAPESVASCLLNGTPYNAFETYVIEIRDENELIAAGIFDNGLQSIAGIMNFYHPDYRKHSLGKYLMLLKINFARQHQKLYYYPGYVVSHYPKFDYKLFPDEAATDIFDSHRASWLLFSWATVTVLTDEANEPLL